MLKLMLVDDEKNIIERLKILINWGELGVDICGEASDGSEAILLIESCIPDVIISDINMPNLDGLKLAAHIKEKYPNIKFILLTGYEDFNYARQAANIGVFHYLLKPVERNELKDIVERVKQQIIKERESEKYIETLKDKAELSESLIRQKFLNWLVSGHQALAYKEVLSKLEFYKIPLKNGKFQVVSIEIDRLNDFCQTEEHAELCKNAVLRVIDDIMVEIRNYAVFNDGNNRLNIIIGEDCSSNCLFESTDILCEKIRMAVTESIGITITSGYGRKHDGYENIFKSYYEAIYALKYKFILGEDKVIGYNSIEAPKSKAGYNSIKSRNDLLAYLRLGNLKNLNNTLNSIFGDSAARPVTVEYVQMLCVDLILTGIIFANESGASIQDIFGHSFDPLEAVKSKETLNEVREWILDFYRSLVNYMSINKLSGSKRIVEKAIRFIKSNIEDSGLNVRMVSRELNVNEDYLSSLFKKEMGVPLIKFLNNYRMEKSKEYMDNGWFNLYEVARKVGYEDQFYFSKCFKKHFGISPSMYLEGK